MNDIDFRSAQTIDMPQVETTVADSPYKVSRNSFVFCDKKTLKVSFQGVDIDILNIGSSMKMGKYVELTFRNACRELTGFPFTELFKNGNRDVQVEYTSQSDLNELIFEGNMWIKEVEITQEERGAVQMEVVHLTSKPRKYKKSKKMK